MRFIRVDKDNNTEVTNIEGSAYDYIYDKIKRGVMKKVIDYIGNLTYNEDANCWKTIREYLIRCKFHTSLKIRAHPEYEWCYIGKKGEFKDRDALKQWEISNYEQEKYAIATEFSKYCLKHVILNANEDTFEQFLDFNLSPYKDECHPDDIVECFRQYYYSYEKFFDKFFQYGIK